MTNHHNHLDQSQNLGIKIKKHEIELRGAMSEMAIASNGWHEVSQREVLPVNSSP